MNNDPADQQDQDENRPENSNAGENNFAREDPYRNYFKTGYQICHEEIQNNEYLVDNIIVRQAVNGIVGGSGAGKSTLLRQLALAIVDKDETFLGFKLTAVHHLVLYVSTEDPQHQWKKYLMQINENGDIDIPLQGLHILFGVHDRLIPAVESRLKNEKFDLIILDVYSDIFNGDPNNAISVRKFINVFKNFAQLYGVTVLFVHHNSKGAEKSAPSKNSVLGSQAFESSMRSLIELRVDQYDSSKRHLCILKQNYLAEEQKKQSFVLQLNEEMIFSNTGERTDMTFLSVTSQKVVEDELLTHRILELHRSGMASRSISEALKEQGLQVGKTKVAEIIKRYKDENAVTESSDMLDDEGPEMGKIVCMNLNGEDRLVDLDEDANEDEDGDLSQEEE